MSEKSIEWNGSTVRSDSPDFVVGVDFGTTSTGVSYSYAPDWPAPRLIQHWPGLKGNEIANKVPSKIRYCPSTSEVEGWGFQCFPSAEDDEEKEKYDTNLKRNFKLYLDPLYRDENPELETPSYDDAMKYLKDFIQSIYRYIVSHLNEKFPHFISSRVEFILGVSTTWKDPRTVAEFWESIQLDSPYHSIVIGLTEAEAAAAYREGIGYKIDDVVLFCDSGGGTSVVDVLKVGDFESLTPLGIVDANYMTEKRIGSEMINKEACLLISNKLESARAHFDLSVHDIAWEMVSSSKFEEFKCAFGTHSKGLESLNFELDCSMLSSTAWLPLAEKEGQVTCTLTGDEMQYIFDSTVNELSKLIDKQIISLQQRHPLEHISFIVLSGGLGCSPYVTKALGERYDSSRQPFHPIKILTVNEPQLAVTQGQVMYQIRQLKQGSTMIPLLCSPASYGVICDKVFDPTRHNRERLRYDERDKVMYTVEQIDWLVLQGSPTPRNGFSKEFKRKIYPREQGIPWKAQIVMSMLPPSQLPSSMKNDEEVTLICNIEVEMPSVEKKLVNRHWYNFRPAYFQANIIVKIIVGSTGLQFELWNKTGGRIQTRDQNPLTVNWMPMGEKKTVELQGTEFQEFDGSPARQELTGSPVLQTSIVVRKIEGIYEM